MTGNSLVVVIPAFNERKTIAKVVQSIPRDVADSVKVLVVDDGSKDGTSELARKGGADKVIRHKMNKGLGTAFRTGLDGALGMGADIIVTIDADGQFNSHDIAKLVKPIIQEKADMVTCTRFKDPRTKEGMSFWKFIGNNGFTWFINSLTGENFTDTQCGFRAYTREAALRLTTFGKFTYTQEVFLDLAEKGMKIKEVPCRVKPKREGKSRIVKSPLSYGLKALLIISRAQRDYKPLKFFGTLSAISLLSALLLTFFLVVRPFPVYFFTPNWAMGLFITSLIMFTMALLADMMDRQRKLQEEVLYELRKKHFSA